jgi:hypothetical protein
MNNQEFKAFLKDKGACNDAMEWLDARTAKQTFEECHRGDWLLWWLRRESWIDINQIKRVALECAKLALPYMKDERSKNALIVVERYLEGNATRKELLEARAAAAAAAADATAAAYSTAATAAAATAAYSTAATAAAAAAAYSTAATADAYAADAAYAAYAAAYAADASIKIRLATADLCRKYIKLPDTYV